MKCIGGYRVAASPRYLTGREEACRHNGAVQAALWSALNYLLLLEGRVAIELRLCSDAASRRVDPFLLFWQIGDGDVEVHAEQLAGLLPVEYAWEPVEAALGHQPIIAADRLHMVRCSRRMDFVDLPTRAALFSSRVVSSPTQRVSATPGGAGQTAVGSGTTEFDLSVVASDAAGPPPTPAPQQPSTRPSAGLGAGLGADLTASFANARLRLLPALAHNLTHPSTWPDLCIPIVGEVRENSLGDERLFEQLIRCAPAAHSVLLLPDDHHARIVDQTTALRWRRFVEPFIHVIANTGLAPVRQVRSVYDRYWLPKGQLVKLAIVSTASTPAHAVAVAQSAAIRFGGLHAFTLGSARAVASTAVAHRDPTIDPHGVENARQRVLQTLHDAGVAMSEVECLDFLHRMPHLFTLDEAVSLVSLPFTDLDGLPGLQTRPVVPFSDAVLGFRPLHQVPPTTEIRIGLSRGGDGTAAGTRSPTGSFANWHTMAVDDLAKHAFVTGSTGSGKSTATRFVAGELLRLGIPMMIIEPVKGEYHAALTEMTPWLPSRQPIVRRCTDAGADGRESPDYLTFDPLTLPRGVTVARHIAYLKGCFQAAFPMEESVALVLENGLWAYYRHILKWGPFHRGATGETRFARIADPKVLEEAAREGLYLPDEEGRVDPSRSMVLPSFESFAQFFLLNFLPAEIRGGLAKEAAAKAEEWKQYFRRRFRNLMLGPLGVCFRRANDICRREGANAADPLESLLEVNAIVELEALADEEQKSLAMAFLLTAMFERRQADGNIADIPGKRLKHVLIVEEAHRLLSSSASTSRSGDIGGMNAQGRAIRLFTDMLAEIRSYGQGLVIVEQIPTKIAPEVLKNTNLKVMLRLNSADDREFLGRAMGLREEHLRFVANLKRGEMVVFNDSLDQPVLLDVAAPKLWPKLFAPAMENRHA